MLQNVQNAVLGGAQYAADRLTPKVWSSGLCDCGQESQSCLDVVFCLPCQISRQCMAIDGVPNMMDCCYCFCSTAVAYYGGIGVIAAVIRYRMIEKYNIQMEGAIQTFAKGYFCFPCSLCQTNRELMKLGANPSGTCCVPPPVAPKPLGMK